MIQPGGGRWSQPGGELVSELLLRDNTAGPRSQSDQVAKPSRKLRHLPPTGEDPSSFGSRTRQTQVRDFAKVESWRRSQVSHRPSLGKLNHGVTKHSDSQPNPWEENQCVWVEAVGVGVQSEVGTLRRGRVESVPTTSLRLSGV